MTAKSTITLTDAASTGAGATARTFTPGGMLGPVHTFYNDDTGTSGAALSRLTASISRSSGAFPARKIKFSLALPLETTVDGVPTVSHENRFYGEFIISDKATEDERRDLAALVTGIHSHVGLYDMIHSLEDLY